MIRREDIADLQPGDVVRITGWYGVTIEGPVQESMGSLWLGQHCRVTSHAGEPAAWMHMDADDATLTVVSRAPRPLYVNHPRTEPVPGDVVRDADGDGPEVWMRSADADWSKTNGSWTRGREDLPARLRLLVDGETGMPVGPDLGDAWDQGFEAGHGWWATGMSGQPVDPPANPYETGQVVP